MSYASVIIYFVFLAISIALKLPEVQDVLRTITLMCDTGIPLLTQAADDSYALIETATNAGLPDDVIAEINQAYDDGVATVTIMETMCGCLLALVATLDALLTPALLCVTASLCAGWMSFGNLCSSCCSPKTKVAPTA